MYLSNRSHSSTPPDFNGVGYPQDPNYPPPRVQYPYPDARRRRERNTVPPWMRRQRRGPGCLTLSGPLLVLLLVLAVYLLAPFRTNILLLGIDYTPWYSKIGRSDTMVLTTFVPLKPYIGMLSIPRDLWVTIPGYGENRINTAHFFAEAQTGTGPQVAMQTVQQNFGVNIDYFVRIRFDGFREVIDALGGVDVVLDEPQAGYPAGKVHLTGNKALAFARNRMGSDDFFRMERGQLVMKSALKEMLYPTKWIRLPAVAVALMRSIDTNIPVWEMPRLGMALLRAGSDGIDSQTITREMVSPYITPEGADVLLPNWEQINPLLMNMFGQ